MIKDISKYTNYIRTHKTELTVFVLTYNRSNYLKQTIESILKQTYKDFVLVILDNASTDDTPEVINNFSDSRLIYLRQESNVGGPGNINTGVEIADTPYYILFHDDDLMLPEFLETSLTTIKNYNYDLLGSFGQHIDENGEILNYYRLTSETPIEFKGSKYFESFLETSPYSIYCPSVIFKNDFIKKNKLTFNYLIAGPACDVFLWFESEKCGGKIGLLPLELFQYRRHKNQDSSINNSYIQLKLLDCLLNIDYYNSLLILHRNKLINFLIFAVIIELLLAYKTNKDYKKLTEVLNSVSLINSTVAKSKKISLISAFGKQYPTICSYLLFYAKETYSFYKKYKYSKA